MLTRWKLYAASSKVLSVEELKTIVITDNSPFFFNQLALSYETWLMKPNMYS